MRIIFFSILIFFQFQLKGNMAEPVMQGTVFSRPFTSQFVYILREDLKITIGEKFQSAQIEIEYHINASKNGIRVPLLFYASEMKDSFSVEVDGKPVAFQPIPDDLKAPAGSKFSDFSYFFNSHYRDSSKSVVLIEDSPKSGFFVDFNDLYYFETDIPKGQHIIKVSYIAESWLDQWDWVNEYSFRYVLSPAKYWKSFGGLSITLDASGFGKPIKTNLGNPSSGSLDSIAVWNFSYLPTEVLKVSYTPEINDIAAVLIRISPFGLAVVFGSLLMLVHFFLVRAYRQKHPEKKISKVVILGSIIVPFLFFSSWAYFYVLIDSFIGEHASKQHGYEWLVVLLIPLAIPFYLGILWMFDRYLKGKLRRL